MSATATLAPTPTDLAPKIEALGCILAAIAQEHSPAALASSLSAEDMVLTDAILRAGVDIEIFTLDTGRLHGDTLAVIAAVQARYGYAITPYRPEPQAVGDYVAQYGRDAFYESIALRKRCCEIRKVEPLRRALAGKRAWLTGLRRSQSVTRNDLQVRVHDPVHGLEKFSPLADWSEAEVWAYIRTYEVPYNALHDQGYPSIGCAPCTRPVTQHEDPRAGRWWWEQPESRECGLHVGADGKLVRARGTIT